MSSSKDAHRHYIDMAANAASAFVKSFYPMFDAQRAQLRPLYKESSTIVWNGTSYTGPAFREFYLTLPATEHRVDAFDAQPVLASITPSGTCSFLVTVNGTVTFASDKKSRKFSDSFTLSPVPDQPTVHYISSECFRFV
ncbi:NTF2- export protein 2 [Blastocladiella emersonii ATCC 22665]|nr:NTF2- export protein 2 [Blastocladiella emersonii ATCC 22665]